MSGEWERGWRGVRNIRRAELWTGAYCTYCWVQSFHRICWHRKKKDILVAWSHKLYMPPNTNHQTQTLACGHITCLHKPVWEFELKCLCEFFLATWQHLCTLAEEAHCGACLSISVIWWPSPCTAFKTDRHLPVKYLSDKSEIVEGFHPWTTVANEKRVDDKLEGKVPSHHTGHAIYILEVAAIFCSSYLLCFRIRAFALALIFSCDSPCTLCSVCEVLMLVIIDTRSSLYIIWLIQGCHHSAHTFSQA